MSQTNFDFQEPDSANVQEQILQLRKTIERHNQLYYVDAKPEISDREYDLLIKELEDLEKLHPEFDDPLSPTHRVGEKATEGFQQITHAIPMLSISNTYNPDELREFDQRIKKLLDTQSEIEYVVELKIDGVALSIRYENGRMVYAATRGDGVQGDDVTANVMTIRQVPLQIDFPKNLSGSVFEVRGEVYMNNQDFDKLNEERIKAGEDSFANPRNFTAGSLKMLDPKVVATRPLRTFLYARGESDYNLPETHIEYLALLKELGFPTNPEYALCSSIEKVLEKCNEWETKREKLDYATDGLVIKVNHQNLHEILGSTSKSPRWLCAYKFSAEQAETTLKEITVQIGRTGAATPVANLEPVFLEGTTVSRATLHNAEEIERLNLRIGDRVIIEKGGGIIPKIIKSLPHLRKEGSVPFKFPTRCPNCISELVKEEGEVAIRCINVSCPAQLAERLMHFAGRDAMDIEGMGSQLVQQLVDQDLIQSLADLYTLNQEQVEELERMGKKSAANLIDGLEKSKTRPFAAFIFALGIRFVGKNSAKLLCDTFRSIEDFKKATLDDFIAIDGVGDVMAQSIVDFFQNEQNQKLLERLFELGLNPKVEERIDPENLNSQIAGKTFVLTGTLPTLSRSEAQKKIEAAGGKASGSVSSKTNYVVAGESAGSKLEKAKKLGVEIIDEAGLLNLLGE